MVRLRCDGCEDVVARAPAAQAEHVARLTCWRCQRDRAPGAARFAA